MSGSDVFRVSFFTSSMSVEAVVGDESISGLFRELLLHNNDDDCIFFDDEFSSLGIMRDSQG
jgi:hypothetical protein